MNIGLLHYSAPPVVGGVESILAQHARLLIDAGHRVRIIAGRGNPRQTGAEFAHLPLVDSTQESILATKRDLDRGVVPQHFETLIAGIAAALQPAIRDLDVLVAHNVCSLHKNLALTAALEAHARSGRSPSLILWHHDFAWTAPRYASELYDGYPWNLLRSRWPNAREVVVSHFRRKERATLTGSPQSEITVIPNGISVLSFLQIDGAAQEIIQRFDLLSSAPLMLLPVRITRRKNIELALRITHSLARSFPRTTLLITGPPGPHNISNFQYFEELKQLRTRLQIESRVHFLADLSAEYLPDEVIHGLYRISDLLLLPSQEEGFGLPVIEASQARLPVFCSDIPALRELGGDSVTYFSPDAAAESVALLIEEFLGASKTFKLSQELRNLEWRQLYNQRIAPLLLSVLKSPQ